MKERSIDNKASAHLLSILLSVNFHIKSESYAILDIS